MRLQCNTSGSWYALDVSKESLWVFQSQYFIKYASARFSLTLDDLTVNNFLSCCQYTVECKKEVDASELCSFLNKWNDWNGSFARIDLDCCQATRSWQHSAHVGVSQQSFRSSVPQTWFQEYLFVTNCRNYQKWVRKSATCFSNDLH